MQFLSLAVVALVSATAGVLLYLWMAQQWAKPPVEVIDVAPAPRPQRATAVAETVSPEAISVESEPAFSPSRTPERSPMLGPDETLEAPIPFGQLAPIEKPVIPPGQPVPWTQAVHFVGQTITVQGAVVDTNNLGKVCFLNFTTDWRGQFYVVVFEPAFAAWPQPPEEHFLNKTIRVTGEVKVHQGRPQIQVHDPKQVELVEID